MNADCSYNTPTVIEPGLRGKEIYNMNKLFTKIAALAVGAAMVIGVGIAVGQKSHSKIAYAETTSNSASFNLGPAATVAGRWLVGGGTGTTNANSTSATAWAKPDPDSGTHTYTDTMKNADACGQKWTATYTYAGAYSGGTTSGGAKGTAYQQFGKKDNPPTTLTFVSSALTTSKNLTAFSVKYGGSGSGAASKATLKAGSSTVKAGSGISETGTETVTWTGSIFVETGTSISVEFSGMTHGTKVFYVDYTLSDLTAQTISGRTSAYVDESVTLTSNATSPTWSIVTGSGNTDAEGASVTSGGIVSVTGAGKVVVKATKGGYIDATHTITFSERPSEPYIHMVSASYEKYVGDVFNASFTYGNIDDANLGDITFVSDDDSIADVTENASVVASAGTGTISLTCKAAGTATFMVSYGGDDLDIFEVVVSNRSISITLDKTTATLWEGKTLTLTPTVVANGYSESVSWSSNKTDVATVSSGVASPVSEGVATIKCSSVDYPSEFATCVVTVKFVPSLYFDLDLSTDKTTSASDSNLSWVRTYGNISMDKASASTNTNNYYPGTSGESYTSTRFYKNSVLTITNTDRISVIDFTATTISYANKLASSTWTNAVASATETSVRVLVTDSSANISCTIGDTCGFTNIRFYCEKSWSEDFIDTFTCTGAVEGHLNGDISVANPTVVWASLNTSFSELKSDIRNTLKTISANESGDANAQAMARYDLVIRKYNINQGNESYNDFIGRFSAGGANAARVDATVFGGNTFNSTTLIIVLVSILSLASVGGYFLIRRRKEN